MLHNGIIIPIQIAMLYGIYLIGKGIQNLFDLFIPGSVIGMILLFTILSFKVVPEWILQRGITFMIRHLPFFFIPATVGVISYAYVFKGKGVLLIGIGLLSTALVMALAGLVTQWMVKRREEA